MKNKAKQVTIPISYNGDVKNHEEDYDNLSWSLSSINEDDVKNNRPTQLSHKLLETIFLTVARCNFTSKYCLNDKSGRSIRGRYYSKLGLPVSSTSHNNKPEKDSLEELLNSMEGLPLTNN